MFSLEVNLRSLIENFSAIAHFLHTAAKATYFMSKTIVNLVATGENIGNLIISLYSN